MRATGVELYHYGSLLLRTVTYDDGHYEFDDLSAGEYELKVVASGYVDVSYSVIVESGRTARADLQLERLNTYLVVRTLAATEVNEDKVTLNGSYSYQYNGYQPNEVGFTYSTAPSPNNGGTTITSSVSRSFSSKINNLKKGKYYFQAYAKNKVGTEYGEILLFEVSGTPIVTTLSVTNVTNNTATLNGRVDYKGDPAYTERGFVYTSLFPNPTVDDPATATTKVAVSGSSKEFSVNVTGLTANTYYARAYITNSEVTSYGETVTFFSGDYITLSNDGIMVHRTDISSGSSYFAAKSLCQTSAVGGFSDWRLPNISECGAMNSHINSLVLNTQFYYWTADFHSEIFNYDPNYNLGYYDYFYYVYAFGNDTHINYKIDNTSCRVRCVRTLK